MEQDTTVAVTEKPCSKCGEVKPFTAFGKHNRGLHGLTPSCKACQKAYRTANRERIAARQKEWRDANSERVRANRERHYRENGDRLRAQMAEYRAANPEAIRERKADYPLRREQVMSAFYVPAPPEGVDPLSAAWINAHRVDLTTTDWTDVLPFADHPDYDEAWRPA